MILTVLIEDCNR